jgi:hypothetical protein
MHGIQEIFRKSYDILYQELKLSDGQAKAARDLINCKSKELGYNVNTCSDCGHSERHYNSCRNRHCPSCQAVTRERETALKDFLNFSKSRRPNGKRIRKATS